jgi:hypothetical protein
MGIHSLLTDCQVRRDFLVAHACSHQSQHLQLLLRQEPGRLFGSSRGKLVVSEPEIPAVETREGGHRGQMGLLPTLALSDPHRDPHWAGQGRIPLDGSAANPTTSQSGLDLHGRPWTALARTGNAVSGADPARGSGPHRSAGSWNKLTRHGGRGSWPVKRPPGDAELRPDELQGRRAERVTGGRRAVFARRHVARTATSETRPS